MTEHRPEWAKWYYRQNPPLVPNPKNAWLTPLIGDKHDYPRSFTWFDRLVVDRPWIIGLLILMTLNLWLLSRLFIH